MRPRAHTRWNSLEALDFVFSLIPERTGRIPISALQPPSAAGREQVWRCSFRASSRIGLDPRDRLVASRLAETRPSSLRPCILRGQGGKRAGFQARSQCLSILTRQVISDLNNKYANYLLFPCQAFSFQNGLNEIPWQKDFWKQRKCCAASRCQQQVALTGDPVNRNRPGRGGHHSRTSRRLSTAFGAGQVPPYLLGH